jgi:hypothetical protein
MRTDIHSPKNIVLEDYEYAACGFFPTGDEPGYSPLAHELAYLLKEGWHMAENHAAGDCYHCGAHLTYYAILKHVPTQTFVRVGEQCLDNRFDMATAEFQRLRKERALNRERRSKADKMAAWFAVDPDREVAYCWASDEVEAGHYGFEGMRANFVHGVNRYGSASDKFVRAMMRDMARTERRAEERAREEAEPKAPVVEGRGVCTGEVVSVQWRENDFGGSLKMLFKDDRGFKLWGTVPSSISNAERGDRITFTATVSTSNDDPSFGFFSRPSKADFINNEED